MAVITSAGTGNSNSGGTWTGGAVPDLTSDVQILSGHTITLDTTHTWNSLDLQSGGTLDGDGNELTIDGEDGGGLAVDLDGAISGTDTDITLTGSHGTEMDLVASSGNIRNLTINKSGDEARMVGATTISGDVTITAGQLSGQTADHSFGSLTIASGGTYSATSGTTTITSHSSNWVLNNSGTFTHNDGLVHSTQTAVNNAKIDMDGDSLYDLQFTTHPRSTKIESNTTIANDFTLTSGYFSTGSDRTLTVSGDAIITAGAFYGNASTITMGSLTINGGTFTATSGTTAVTGALVLASSGTLTEHASGTITCGTGTDIQKSLTTVGNWTLTGDCEFDAVTVSSGDTLDLNGQRMECSGLFTNSGTTNWGGSPALHIASRFIIGGENSEEAGANFIVTGGSAGDDNDFQDGSFVADATSNILFNNGTTSVDWDGSGYYVGNIIAASPLRSQHATNNKCASLTVPTGGTLDGDNDTLTVAGDFTTSGGLIGKSALLFDGGNDYCNGPSLSGGTLNPTDNLYVEAWWKSTDGTPETTSVIGKASSYLLYINGSGYLQGYVYGSSSNIDATYSVSIFDQKWHHCAMGYSRAGGLKVWLDGKLVATNATDAGTLTQNANDIRLMRHGSNYGQGTLAMGRIWTGAVPTDAQLRSNMFKGEGDSPAYTSGVIQTAWYFDEGTGTGTDAVEDVGVGTNCDLDVDGAAWAGAGTFTYGTSTLVMSGTGTLNMKYPLNLVYNLTASGTTTIKNTGDPSGVIDVKGATCNISGTLLSFSSEALRLYGSASTSNNITLSLGNAATSIPDLHVLYAYAGDTATLPALTTERIFANTGTALMTGDATITTELQIASGATFNANGNTIAAKLVDLNSGTLNLTNSTLNFSVTSGGDSFHLYDGGTLTTGNTTVNGHSSAAPTTTWVPSGEDFEIVGDVSNLAIQAGGDLTVVGSVTGCTLADSTANIRQWHHTLDTQQLLDADSAGDDDLKLTKPALDNAHELMTG